MTDMNDAVKPVKLCNCGAQMPSTPCDPACPDDLGTYTLPAEDCAALIAVSEMTDAEPENRMVPRRVDTATPDPVDEWPGGSDAIDFGIEDLEKAQKHDTDKAPLAWVSAEFIEGTAKVLAFGGNKYAPGNWSKGGFTYTQLTSAILRHLLAANSGEDLDPESGLPHLYHASCGLMFLSTHCERGSIVDDRVEKGVAVDD